MIDHCGRAARNLGYVIRNGLAAIAILHGGLSVIDSTVLLMRPVEATWCASGDYVQASFIGVKIHDRWPVPGSFAGQANFGRDMMDDVLFMFPKDPTPDSSRPPGWGFGSFGIWRWYTAALPDSVSMSMRHMDADGEYPITFGPFTVPGIISDCD